MLADASWQAFYAAGDRVFLSTTVLPRLVVFGGAMATTFAVIARIVSIGGAIWMWRAGFDPQGPARAWAFVLIAAARARRRYRSRCLGGSNRCVAARYLRSPRLRSADRL